MACPSLAFDGNLDRYPCRDEVTAYLTRYADELTRDGAQSALATRVTAVTMAGGGFRV